MTAMKAMMKYVARHPVLWAVGILIPAIANLTANLFLAYGMQAYTEILTKPDATLQKVVTIMLAVLASLLVSTLIEDAARTILALFVTKTENNIKQDLYAGVICSRYKDAAGLDRGQLFTKYNKDSSTAANLISWDIFAVLFPIVLGTGYLVSIFGANTTIGFIMLTLAVAVILLNLFFVKRFFVLEKKTLLSREGYTQMCDSAIQGKLSLRQMSAGAMFAGRIGREAARMYENENDIVRLTAGRAVSLELLATMCSTLMAPLACVFATLGWIALPGIVLIAQLCRYLILFTNHFGVAITSFGSHSVSYGRLKSILDLPDENTSEGEPVSAVGSDILEFGHVGISYDSNDVLTDVNLKIRSGEIVALLGPSGSGKSSLVKALLRLTGHSGCIKLFNKDIDRLSLQELRHTIAYVPEHSELFDATVYENISYADPDADAEKIEGVLHQAALDEETGFSSREAGENGCKLSGGQRQRVAIARALLKDVPLVIFDEPTASLDAISEEKVLRMIVMLKAKGKGVILITHRESTMKIADRVMMIQDNTIKADISVEEAVKALGKT